MICKIRALKSVQRAVSHSSDVMLTRRAGRRWCRVVAPLIALLLMGAGSVSAQESPGSLNVTTAQGSVRGIATPSVAKFLGIPYASAPVGALRWRPPQPHSGWDGTRDATQFGAICPQPTSGRVGLVQSEDCLVLNVYAPYPLTQGRKVMVWVHGGTNTDGAARFYDPTPLVTAGDVIVVTINYRLGALGFLSHAALAAESGTTGNYGLTDQQMALHWVQDNIAAFGGDPHDVTLSGQSSGGVNVISQLVSPASAGLFHKAIVESGSFVLDTEDLKTSEGRGQEFAARLGCRDQSVDCLRSKSADEVLANQGNPWGGFVGYALSTVDGVVLPMSQRVALGSGQFHRVPVLFGSNSEEGRLFVPPGMTATDYPSTLTGYAKAAGRSVAGVLTAYPLADAATPTAGAAAAFGDSVFACSSLVLSGLLAPYTTLFEYEFADDAQGAAPQGATHGYEVRYLFGLSFMGPALNGSPADLPPASQALSLAMRRYWAGFMRGGAPDHADLPPWPLAVDGKIQLLVAPHPQSGSVVSYIHRHKCDYWN